DDGTPHCNTDCTDNDSDGYCAPVACDDSVATGASCNVSCGTFYADADGDGYGDAGGSVVACVAPVGYAADDTDCEDSNANCNADGTDADGDGFCATVDCDDSAATGATCNVGCGTFYADADGDGYGDAGASIVTCSQPVGYVADDTDCDDTNPNCNT